MFNFEKTKGWIEEVKSQSPGGEGHKVSLKVCIKLQPDCFDPANESHQALLDQFRAYVDEVKSGDRKSSNGFTHSQKDKWPACTWTFKDVRGRELRHGAEVKGTPKVKAEGGMMHWEARLDMEAELLPRDFALLYDASHDRILFTLSDIQEEWQPHDNAGQKPQQDTEQTEIIDQDHRLTGSDMVVHAGTDVTQA